MGYNSGAHDPAGSGVKSAIRELGVFSQVDWVRAFSVYIIEGTLSREQVNLLGRELLADPIVQNFSVDSVPGSPSGGWLVEVRNKLGVTDAVGNSTLKAIETLGVSGATKSVRTGVDYFIKGELDKQDVKTICERVLANRLIHEWRISRL